MSLIIKALVSSSKGNCYLVSNGKTSLLVEAGITWVQIRLRTNFNTSEIAACLISHSHMDHARAASDVMRAGIDCYASLQTFEALGIAGHKANILDERVPKTVGEISFFSFGTIHDTPGSVGFLICDEISGDRLLFLTDTAYVKYLFKDLTHIVIEANFSLEILNRNIKSGRVDESRKKRLIRTHMSIERVIDLLKVNDLSRVREIRLIHLSDHNSDAELFKKMVQAATGKHVYVEAE